MDVRGHTLVWHRQLPGWVSDVTDPARMRVVVREHIETVVGRYRGRVVAWDVVNEGISDDGTGLKSSPFLDVLGPGYVADVFRIAHEADPDALLFFNDYEIAELGDKSDRLYALARDLLADGVPIHGIGMQMHVTAAYPPDLASFAANVRRFESLGLFVDITEMDVRIRELSLSSAAARREQARVYHDVIAERLRLPNLTSISFWGFTDARSWIDQHFGEDDPLLFSEALSPKPAYFAVNGALAEARRAVGVPFRRSPSMQ
jgi:endo-1,4-beta-xylanase